jgi:poly-gamma-glutamate synthesis protein (capsule biosynthesis protein)
LGLKDCIFDLMGKSFLNLIIFLIFGLSISIFILFEVQKTQKEIENLASLPPIFLESKKEKITLFFVGDIMLDRGVKMKIKNYGKGDYKFPFLKVSQFLKKADLLIGNLEGPISDKGKKVGSIYSFRMEPQVVEGLKFAGFDILTLANNHIFDYTKLAMEDTILRLKEVGIDYLGAGLNYEEACSPKVKEIKNTKVAFLAFTNLGSPFWQAKENSSGICWLNEENLKRGIEKAKEKADIIVVLFHFGDEYKEKANSTQKYFSHLAIDLGADLVVGHHPHVVQEIENYNGKYIAYSLGNFIFDQNFSEKTMEGLLLKVLIEGKKIKEIFPIKTKLNRYFQVEILK